MKTITGSDIYRAPELFYYDEEYDLYYSIETEVWSLGILFYELFYGKYIYKGMPSKPNKVC